MSNNQPNIPRKYARSAKSITKAKNNNPPPPFIIPRVSFEQFRLDPSSPTYEEDKQRQILETEKWAEQLRNNDGAVVDRIKHLFTVEQVKGYTVKPGKIETVDIIPNLDGTSRIIPIRLETIYDPPLPPDAVNEHGDPIKRKTHLYLFAAQSITTYHVPTDQTLPDQSPIAQTTLIPDNELRIDTRYGALIERGMCPPYNYIALLEAKDKVSDHISHVRSLENSHATREEIEAHKAATPIPLIFACEGIKTTKAMAEFISSLLFQRAMQQLASSEYAHDYYQYHNPAPGISPASIKAEYSLQLQRANSPSSPIDEYIPPLSLPPGHYLPIAIGYYGGAGPKGAKGINYALRPYSNAAKEGLIIPDVTDCFMDYSHTIIVIMPDKDQAGKNEAKDAYQSLLPLGDPATFRILKFSPPSILPNAWDIADPLPSIITYKDLLSKILTSEPFSQGWIEMPNPKNKRETITNFRNLDNLHRGISKYVSSATVDFAYGNERIIIDPQGRQISLTGATLAQCMYAVNDIMEVPREADFADELSYKKALQTYPCEQVDSIFTSQMERIATGRKYIFETPPATTSIHASLIPHTLTSGHPTFHPSRLIHHAFNVPPPPLPPKGHPAHDDPTIPYTVTSFPPPSLSAPRHEQLGYLYGLLSELIIRNHVETTIGRATPSISKLSPVKPRPTHSVILSGAGEAGKSSFVAVLAGIEPGKSYDSSNDRFTDAVRVQNLMPYGDRLWLSLFNLVKGKIVVEIADTTGGKEIESADEQAMKTATEATEVLYRELGGPRDREMRYTIRYNLFYTTNNNEFITHGMGPRRWLIIDPADAQYSLGTFNSNNIKQYRAHIKSRVNNPEDPLQLSDLSPDDLAIYYDTFPGLERLHHQHGLSVMLAYMHDHLQHLWLTDYFSFRDLSYMMEEKVNGKMHSANWTATLYDYLDRSNPSVDGLTPVMHPSVAIKSEELFAMVKDLGFSQTVTKKALIAALEDWGYVEHVAKIPGDKSSKAYRFWAIQEGAEHGKKAGHIEHSGKAILYCANYISTLGGVRGHIIYSQFGFDNKQIHQPPSKPSTAYTQEELLLHDEYQQPIKEGK